MVLFGISRGLYKLPAVPYLPVEHLIPCTCRKWHFASKLLYGYGFVTKSMCTPLTASTCHAQKW